MPDKSCLPVAPLFRSVVLLLLTAIILPAQPRPHVPSRILVGFKKGTPSSQAQAVIAALQGQSTQQLPEIGVHVVSLPGNANENAVLKAFQNRPEVDFAEFDEIVPAADVTPNDPAYANWQRYYPQISAPTAWSTTTGSSSVVIAIIDTGVDTTHPDLATKLVPGWNIYNNNSNASDVYGHGTLVAGTAAAVTDNGVGVAGVCWQCMIMPIRVSDTSGSATYSNIAAGLNWAAGHGAKVANISYEVSASATVTSAAQNFMNVGGLVTVSAGNEGMFVTASDNPYIVTVGAIDPNNNRYSWSNYGNNIDVVAPGCVFTTVMGGTYSNACGTSVAAPLTAGVAALMFSANPSLTAATAVSMLKQTADDLGSPGWDTTFGYGRVDAAQGVSVALGAVGSGDTTPPVVSISAPPNAMTMSGMVSVQISASDNVGVASVTIAIDGTGLCTVSASPYVCSWNSAASANGGHTVSATARDAAGNATTASEAVTVSNVTDTIPPTISITSPANGSVLGKSVTITTSSSDNVGVVGVDLLVDNAVIATSTTSPFSFKWNPRGVASGVHTLQAQARDAAGNMGISAIVTVYK